MKPLPFLLLSLVACGGSPDPVHEPELDSGLRSSEDTGSAMSEDSGNPSEAAVDSGAPDVLADTRQADSESAGDTAPAQDSAPSAPENWVCLDNGAETDRIVCDTSVPGQTPWCVIAPPAQLPCSQGKPPSDFGCFYGAQCTQNGGMSYGLVTHWCGVFGITCADMPAAHQTCAPPSWSSNMPAVCQ